MSDIKVRVGQQNTVKVISSLSGSTSNATVSESVIGGIGSIRELYVSGISTFVGISTFQSTLFGKQLNISGVTTSNSYYINSNQVISSGRQLQNILSLDNTTKNTISDAINASPNNFTNLYVSGITTLAGITTVSGQTLFSKQLNVSGVATFNQVKLGAVTSYSSIANGDYSNTINLGNDLFIYHVSDPLYGTNFIHSNEYDLFIGNKSETGGNTSFNVLVGIFTGNDAFSNNTSYVSLNYGNSDAKLDTIGAGVTIYGTAFANQLQISGVSTFSGIATFKNNVYIDGDLYIGDDLNFDEFSARNGSITGILTVSEYIDYGNFNSYGIAYFNPGGILTSTQSTNNSIDYTNYILTTDNAGIPIWSNAIDGGFY